MGKDYRTALIRKIQVLRRQRLGADEVAYRALLERATGKDSLRAMSPAELGRVADVLAGQGQPWGQPGPGRERRASGAVTRATDAQIARLRAAWDGFARHEGFASLEAWLRRYWRCERVEWLTRGQASRIIAALDGMAAAPAREHG